MSDMMVKIKVENLDREIEIPVGQDLRTALMENDIEVYEGFWKLANCQGHGLCGTCQVDVLEGPGLSDMSPWEKARIHGLKVVTRLTKWAPSWLPIPKMRSKEPEKCRLACLARCYQDGVIRTMEPAHSQD